MPYFDEAKYEQLKKNQKKYSSELKTAEYSLGRNKKVLSEYMEDEKDFIRTSENIDESFAKLYDSYMTVSQAYIQKAEQLERKFDDSIKILKKEMQEFISSEAEFYAEKRIDTVDSQLQQIISEIGEQAKETAKVTSECINEAEAKISRESIRLRCSLKDIHNESFFFGFFGNKFNLFKLALFWLFSSLYTTSMFLGYSNLITKDATLANLFIFFFSTIMMVLFSSFIFWIESYSSEFKEVNWFGLCANIAGVCGLIFTTNIVLIHTSLFLF